MRLSRMATMLILLLFARLTASAAESPLVPWKTGGKWGYVDAEGRWAIPPKYEDAHEFGDDGFAEVAVLSQRGEEKRGLIDRRGAWTVLPQWDGIKRACGGAVLAKADGLWRLVDQGGAPIGDLELKDVLSFSEDLALAWTGGRFGYIDAKGRWAIKPEFDGGDDFSGGLAPAKRSGLWGYIDTRGRFVIAPRFQKAGSFVGGAARAKLGGKWGLIDRRGDWAVEPTHDEIDQASEGLWPCKRGKIWGFIDSSGRWIVQPRFEKSSSFASGLAPERDPATGSWGYIDKRGAWAIEPAYSDARAFEGGLARAKRKGADWALIDAKGAERAVLPYSED